MKYKIYPKKGGDRDPVELEMGGFEINGSLLRPRDRGGEPSGWGFLNLENIAAVVPEPSQEESQKTDAPYFNVFIKGREIKPFRVYAQAIDFSETELRFCWLNINMGAAVRVQKVPLPNVYVALSEIVAVVYYKGFLEASLDL